MRSIRGVIRATALPLVAGLTLAAALTAGQPSAPGGSDGELIVLTGPSGGLPGRWAIAGGPVTGLAPGTSRTLRLRVTNPHPYDLRVERVHVTLTPGAWTGHRRCANSTDNLVVSRWLGRPFVVKARASVTVPTSWRVRMPMSVSAACQGATFPLTYTGYATKAARR
jgi:hypothetical protein